MKLSILDVLPISSAGSARDALNNAVSLAQLGERLGYERIWYAEHHGMANIASTSPELLIAHVAPTTKRIRVGAGGVMLPNHVPLRVVEQYRTLEALHPGRIDLGIGRAAGTDPLTAHALRSASGNQFGALLGETLAFDAGVFPVDHPYSRIGVTPGGVHLPPIYMLGSSGGSARLAGQQGFGYAFASHFSPMPPSGPIATYKRHFEPTEPFPEPYVILAAHALCAETQDEVDELALAPLYALTHLQERRNEPVPTPAEVRAKGFEPGRDAKGMAQLLIYGTPDVVRARLHQAAEEAGADEVMIMTLTHAHEPRLRSYELLAGAN